MRSTLLALTLSYIASTATASVAEIRQAVRQDADAQAWKAERQRAFLDVAAGLSLTDLRAVNEEVFQATFGVPFVVGEGGFTSKAASGGDLVDGIELVENPSGGTAVVDSLELWPIDPEAIDLEMPGEAASYQSVEVHVYAATFVGPGASVDHVGFAVSMDDGAEVALVYSPLVTVSGNGDLSGWEVGAFLDVMISDSGSFTDLVGEPEPDVTGPGDEEPPVVVGKCDEEALEACLDGVFTAYVFAHQLLDGERRAKINAAVAAWFAPHRASLGGSLVSGIVIGALVGAVGGPGSAAIGALIGAIGGAVGWLVEVGSSTDQVQEEIDAINAEYDEKHCDLLEQVAADLVACAQEHCPPALPAIEQEAQEIVEEAGCS